MVEYAHRHQEAPTAESRFYDEFSDTLIKVRVSKTPGAMTFREDVQALVTKHEIGKDSSWLTAACQRVEALG